jgi:predicted transglutaminase-like cysteine proteinase
MARRNLVKSHLFATLFAFAMLAPAMAEERHVPTNVTSGGVTAAARAEPKWDQIVAYINTLPATHRAGHVNMLLNGLRYASDMQTSGEEDHWDTPLEFLTRGSGDCEDFAIAKYFMLLEAGTPPELLRLAFVFYTGDDKTLSPGAARPKRTHVVALRYAQVGDRDPLVLDAIPRIAPLSERDDLHLVFEFAADGSVTSAVSEAVVSGRAIGKMMTRWTDVLDRMRADGGREAAMVALGNRGTAMQLAQSAQGPRTR